MNIQFWLGVVVGASSLVLLAAWWRLKHAVDADERGHQFALLRQQILEDARWMAHDPKVAPVCERYARMAGKDWKNYAPENVSDFRRRIGCDPSYGVTTAPAPTALDEWRAICEYAPATIMEGRKYLMLSEQACVRLGTALERTSGVLGTDHQTFSLSDADESQERNEEK
jgi:hypothetical protein